MFFFIYIHDDFDDAIEAEYLRKKISCNLNQKYFEFSNYLENMEKDLSKKKEFETEDEYGNEATT